MPYPNIGFLIVPNNTHTRGIVQFNLRNELGFTEQRSQTSHLDQANINGLA